MSAFKYQWNQTIDVGTAGLLSKQWTSIRHILSLLVTANACVHVTAYVAVRRSLSTTYTAVVLGLLLRQYVSYQFGVWAGSTVSQNLRPLGAAWTMWVLCQQSTLESKLGVHLVLEVLAKLMVGENLSWEFPKIGLRLILEVHLILETRR